MVGALDVAQALGDAVPGDAVAAGAVERGRVDGAPLHARVGVDLDLQHLVPGHGHLAVVELRPLQIVEAVLRELPARHDPVVGQHLERGDVGGPQGEVALGAVRRAREPVEVEPVVGVGVLEDFEHVLLDVGRKLGRVEKLLARPQGAGEHAGSALGVGAVRRVGEVERRDGAERGQDFRGQARTVPAPRQLGGAGDVGAAEDGVGIDGEVLEEIDEGAGEPALGTLVLEKELHLVGGLLGLLALAPVEQALALPDELHDLPAGGEGAGEEALLELLQELLAGLRRNARAGRGLHDPRQGRRRGDEGVGQVGLRDADLEGGEVDLGVHAQSLHALPVGARHEAVLLVPAVLEHVPQAAPVDHLRGLPQHRAVVPAQDFLGEVALGLGGDVLHLGQPLDSVGVLVGRIGFCH